MKKQYIGISRDHSGSMSSLTRAAMRDYNENIEAIKSAAADKDIDTIVSVVRCGIHSSVDREAVNTNVTRIRPLNYYEVDASTPLFDSVGELIEILEAEPDASDPDVSFLIMAVTDGEENASRKWKAILGDKIRKLQATDRWTFVFRVPRGYGRALENLGIPSGNIQEWEQTERGMRESSVHTQTAFTSYYAGRASGMRSTDSFYANAVNISKSAARSTLVDVSKQVEFFRVARGGELIQPFVERKTGRGMARGQAFYQLSKPEKAVQSYKMLALRNKKDGKVYMGDSARDLLGLPHSGTIKLSPGDHGDWDIFVQSTSTNRILVAGTEVLYCPNAILVARAAY
jgi:hypothetical protein